MSVFLISGPLQAERLRDGRRMLLRDLVVQVDGVQFRVPKNFITDYSSIPRITSAIVRWSKVDIAGAIHDYLYRTGELSRKESDIIWRKIAEAGDHSARVTQSWTCYLGLRIGSWWTWRKYRKDTTTKWTPAIIPLGEQLSTAHFLKQPTP